MAHGIEKNDNMMTAETDAWHGLGLTVEQAPSPEGALKLSGLDWAVLESETISGHFSDEEKIGDQPLSVGLDSHKMLIRSDDYSPLGIVGRGYSPVQNDELADLCYAITADESGKRMNLKVESAGSLFGGRRVWFLIRGESFDTASDRDTTMRYLLAHNSHDGSSSLCFLPTSVRVVCNNTLTLALNSSRGGYRLRHSRNLDQRIADARQSLGFVTKSFDAQKDQADRLAARSLTAQELQALWTQVYMKVQGYVKPEGVAVDETEASREERKRERMISTLGRWTELFDAEVTTHKLERNAWTGINAVTNWIDHERPMRATSRAQGSREDVRTASNLFGVSCDKKHTAIATALELCS